MEKASRKHPASDKVKNKTKKKRQPHAEEAELALGPEDDRATQHPGLLTEFPPSNAAGPPVSPELEEALRYLKEEVLGNLDAFRPLPVLPRSTYEATSSELEETFRTLREEILYTYPGFIAASDPALGETGPAAELEPSVTVNESVTDAESAAPIEFDPELEEPARSADDSTEDETEVDQSGEGPLEASPEITSLDEFRSKKARSNTKRHGLGIGFFVMLVALIFSAGGGGGGGGASFSPAAPGAGSAAVAT